MRICKSKTLFIFKTTNIVSEDGTQEDASTEERSLTKTITVPLQFVAITR